MNDRNTPEDLVLGVLGGMGPEATADFLSKLVAATPVEFEQQHLRVLVDSNPKVPNRNLALSGRGESAGPMLASMARGLERAGADFLVMACNTAHAFEADIVSAIGVPFVSMIGEACDACERTYPGSRIGILAAQGCIDAGLYQNAFARRGRGVVLLAAGDQQRFMDLLMRVKLGDLSNEVATEGQRLGELLIAAGADIVVAACTEVPLVLRDGALSRPLFDPTMNLARRCVQYAKHLEAIPAQSLVHN